MHTYTLCFHTTWLTLSGACTHLTACREHTKAPEGMMAWRGIKGSSLNQSLLLLWSVVYTIHDSPNCSDLTSVRLSASLFYFFWKAWNTASMPHCEFIPDICTVVQNSQTDYFKILLSDLNLFWRRVLKTRIGTAKLIFS